ncbi:HEAT repeat domain-containing protein [Streptomyces xanthophaeus]
MNAAKAAEAAAPPESTDRAEAPAEPGAGAGAGAAAAPAAPAQAPAAEEEAPQSAYDARRDLLRGIPDTMRVNGGAFGGGAFGTGHHGISGGTFTGNVTVNHLSAGSPAPTSGEVPLSTLLHLDQVFVADGSNFQDLLDRLREDRVLVLTGPRFTGRRTAAFMLLRHLGVASVHALDRSAPPAEIADRLGPEPARGYVLCDPITAQDGPLRDTHLLAARGKLDERSFLVITAGPHTHLEGIGGRAWQPPGTAAVLRSSLRALVDGGEELRRLLDLPAVADFLNHPHQLREAAQFAVLLGRHSRHGTDPTEIETFSQGALEQQVQEWFEDPDGMPHLREKAFLVALAAFHKGPYALTAELSDLLFGLLQQTEDPDRPAAVPVFGTNPAKRLRLARAHRYPKEEETEWGPVTQWMAAFEDGRVAAVLLREVWTGHPSARPALVGWLRLLAADGRAFVRTRAASTAAVLALHDLPSAMALVIEDWARSDRPRLRVGAVNALALAHIIGTPNIPRIIDRWCADPDAHPRLRWAAVRVHGLIGDERPVQTLEALRAAVRRLTDEDTAMRVELAQAVELLLLSDARDTVLAELLRTPDDDPAAADLALDGFLRACRHTEDDEPYGRPLVLDWYAKDADGPRGSAEGIAVLWRALLDGPDNQPALDVLHDWVLAADRDPSTEWALAALLAALATGPNECARLLYLLRSGSAGVVPAVAGRLLTVLPTH